VCGWRGLFSRQWRGGHAVAGYRLTGGGEGLVKMSPAASFREILLRFWPDAPTFGQWLWLSLVLVIVVPLLSAVPRNRGKVCT
jgi:hypothetical protein